jgi:hypothetical protein
VRLIITREKELHEWDLENILEPLKREIELREEHREPAQGIVESLSNAQAGKEVRRRPKRCSRSQE